MARNLVLTLLTWAEGRELRPDDWTAPKCRPTEEAPTRTNNHIPKYKASDFLEAVGALRTRATRQDPPLEPNPYDVTMADFILVALFTAQRKANVKRERPVI